jgi:serine/threonine protein kinase
MAVIVQCPNLACRKLARYSDQSRGRRIRCPYCGQQFIFVASSVPSGLSRRDTDRSGHSTPGSGLHAAVPRDLPEQFGQYRIIRRLGRGGMGTVYLAHDTRLDRSVALKVPHFTPADGPQILERCVREARAAAKIQHPNICPVHDIGQIRGIHYLTMAYIEGRSLAELLSGQGLPSQGQAAALVRKVARGLHEAHRQGVIHRDLKPANIMINRRGEPVVMDFGLAHQDCVEDARLTETGAFLGTLGYLAPERIDGGGAVGPASDIYSLGVILYELLTGQLPFQGLPAAVLAQILTQEPEPPSTFRPDLDPQLQTICLKAIAKRIEKRFPTMMDLADALGVVTRQERYARLGKPASAATGGPTWPDPAALSGTNPLFFFHESPPIKRFGMSFWIAVSIPLFMAAAVSLVGIWSHPEPENQGSAPPSNRDPATNQQPVDRQPGRGLLN